MDSGSALRDDHPVLADLADRATEGLPSKRELQLRRACHDLGLDPEMFDQAAAVLDQVFADLHEEPDDELPEHLRQAIVTQGRHFVAPAIPRPRLRLLTDDDEPEDERLVAPPSGGVWWLAAAAVLAVAIVLARPPAGDDGAEQALRRQVADLQARLSTSDAALRATREELAQARQPVSPREALAQLIASGDVRVVPWKPSRDPLLGGVTGQVVWSDARQEGFMVLKGLKRNDPARQQYQLWIVDGKRPGEKPIDGGLFDHSGEGDEVVVPIDAALPIFDPAAFALTVEKPGGVVVSAGPLRLVAPVE